MPLISVVTPCYNEEENVEELYCVIKNIFASLPEYSYEQIYIDNDSLDRTVEILRKMASSDKNVKVIVNSRNFGHVRSPVYGILQARGDAVILMASDFQDPPELIRQFIKKWEEGYKIVLGVKTEAKETFAMSFIRKVYYDLIGKLSEIELTKNNTGFGLYDRRIIDALKEINDPYPYFRGLVSDIGFKSAKVEFVKPARMRGITKNNFYTLYDLAMLGITNHSKVPLRLATMLGFFMSAVSLLIAIGYLIAKLVFWQTFTIGVAPIIIGLFLFSSVQLFFIGIIGEYIGSIHTQILKRPLVIEKERINF
jgi:polyisoprenyl-phosphate glycosyltransferase